MTTDSDKPPAAARERQARPLVALGLLLVGSLLLAAACSPWIFRWLLETGRAHPALSSWREVEFERVFSRCLSLFAMLGLWPALRWGGRPSSRAWFPRGGPTSRPGRWWLLGVLSLGALSLLGWGLGAYGLVEPAGGWLRLLVLAFVAGLLVGLLEEVFFRGWVLGALERAASPPVALWCASIFYALLHFARPMADPGVVHADALTGFRLLGTCFSPLLVWHSSFPMVVTLLLIGLTLGLVVRAQGHLYGAIALHAGWVFSLQVGAAVLERRPDVATWLLGPDAVSAKSWAALLLAAGGVVLAARYARRAGTGRGGACAHR